MASSENLRFGEAVSNLQSVIDQIKGNILLSFGVNLCDVGNVTACVYELSDNRGYYWVYWIGRAEQNGRTEQNIKTDR